MDREGERAVLVLPITGIIAERNLHVPIQCTCENHAEMTQQGRVTAFMPFWKKTVGPWESSSGASKAAPGFSIRFNATGLGLLSKTSLCSELLFHQRRPRLTASIGTTNI